MVVLHLWPTQNISSYSFFMHLLYLNTAEKGNILSQHRTAPSIQVRMKEKEDVGFQAAQHMSSLSS